MNAVAAMGIILFAIPIVLMYRHERREWREFMAFLEEDFPDKYAKYKELKK
jgi:hypothetical protein